MSAPPPSDRPILGIALMAGFCVLAPLGDSLAKLLGPHVPLLLLLIVRFGFQAVILTPVSLPAMRRAPARVWRIALARTVLHIGGIGCMFTALRFLPLADAISIAFVMPFLLLLLGWLFLDEEVGTRRLGACLVGFAGTLLVLEPAFDSVGLPALLPLGVAVFFAGFMLVTRMIAREVGALALQAMNGWMALALLLPLLAFGTDWPAPEGGTLMLLAAMGVLGTLAHLLMTWSLRFAPAATLAPMQYIEIPVATFFGLVIFGDLPGPQASLGIGLICVAGLYVIWRERQVARRLTTPSAAPP
ncbi:DMT family transporter [Roseivivax sp. GX 12232]|uniref:DMT family transporter n=1 Tax=Roseivivax sp. GX 12232 TaxID=2900547 RepID=UPI001E558597|nr:DMT family transporter [Roseivivax sp. GX 12232]MCE0505295.1 DMT family transporter [Roseivivax sp. GX 12232]